MTGEAIDGGDVCTACGICCDGTLFTHVEVEPDEVERSRKAGVAVFVHKNEHRFSLPCVQLCGTRCGVYEDRPKRCRTFECTTLRAAQSGEIDLAEALKRVSQVRAALQRVKPELLPGETYYDARKRFHKSLAPDAEVTVPPMFRLHMGALALLLDKYFRLPERRFFTSENVQPSEDKKA